ncbi:Core-2/I-branching beta-1,6-N-acetylglucosaminyltransferase family protein [Striga asiatica]|uniref:Core-2/I-branching beta-1,6-N-acetylglucosaminyltransferase family protein n=1 Tax=Striga asiatica TaxID=4170 RepID=A0A5A7PQR2_STRAF|nr:Core-2/I-branching beta-1,6-N-acetylglucosaminyltransferase family protein [Striga asiatica]
MHHHQPPSATSTSAAVPSLYILLGTALFSVLLVLSLTTAPTPPPASIQPHPSLFPHRLFIHDGENTTSAAGESQRPPPAPSLAYFISGSAKDSGRVVRLLHAIYHPRNHYLLHLDTSASQADRDALAVTVQSVPIFKAAQNVHVIGKASNVLSGGPSDLSSTLHGASVLLHLSANWDWFINLSAADYPLITQDALFLARVVYFLTYLHLCLHYLFSPNDLLHVLSYLPKDLNFVNYTGYIGWRESRKLKPIVVDQALFLAENSEMFFATQKRPLPDAYRLFTGSSSAILSRKFIEYCIMGTDNLPRTLLMYLSNTPTSSSVYFPTVLCNTPRFNRTTFNLSLRHLSLDSRQRPRFLNSTDFDSVIESGNAFAGPFHPDDPILYHLDRVILGRDSGKTVPGGWCLGESREDRCNIWGDADVLRPGPGATRLEARFVRALSSETGRCVEE